MKNWPVWLTGALFALGIFGALIPSTSPHDAIATSFNSAAVSEMPRAQPIADAEEDGRDFDAVPDGPLFHDYARWMEFAPGVAVPDPPERRRELVEIWRTASPQLRRYVELARDYDGDLVVAATIYRCGLRDAAWWRRVDHILRRRGQADPALAALRRNLTPEELAAAGAYQNWQMHMSEQFAAGAERTRSCADMASMPFVSRFDHLREESVSFPGTR